MDGYPKLADGLSMEHSFSQQQKEFFRVEPIDEQAPVVVSQYPAVDAFAVGRFADLSIVLADASGIDPASIRLTVGGVGPLAQGGAGLTITGNTITYDSGDTALGAWGATLSATLVAADPLGHALTHTWSFRLEPEPQLAANIFVFGSPTAQRAGQRVSGPAAALAARFPAPAGPVRANDPPPWQIESVLADRVVIAYEAGGVHPEIDRQGPSLRAVRWMARRIHDSVFKQPAIAAIPHFLVVLLGWFGSFPKNRCLPQPDRSERRSLPSRVSCGPAGRQNEAGTDLRAVRRGMGTRFWERSNHPIDPTRNRGKTAIPGGVKSDGCDRRSPAGPGDG
ncbi:MAG: hypothetical protein MUF04_13525 [Akkermansiaceae bacterium]|nr:hypothetical protein [Akkermansiaceae bacterium]